MTGTRWCTRCRTWKPRDEFAERRVRGKQLGRSSHCKPCGRLYRGRIYGMRGLRPGLIEELLETQAGRCAICDCLPPGAKPLMLDHDHQTGAVRALLCNGCNSGLGSLGDDPDRMRAAAAYVELHRSREIPVDGFARRKGSRRPKSVPVLTNQRSLL